MMVITFAALAYILFMKFNSFVIVDGHSMEPTLHNGTLISCDAEFTESDIRRGDIVIFVRDHRPYVKRVIGIPGDSVSVEDGHFMIDGKEPQFEADLRLDPMEYSGILEDGPRLLKNSEFFCAGDNRNHSTDCRVLGPVKFTEIRYIFVKKVF